MCIDSIVGTADPLDCSDCPTPTPAPRAVKPLAEMTRAELQRATAAADRRASTLCDKMIAAGRGHERPSDTRTKADPLSRAYTAAFDRAAECYAERSRRLAWHGNEHRITGRA